MLPTLLLPLTLLCALSVQPLPASSGVLPAARQTDLGEAEKAFLRALKSLEPGDREEALVGLVATEHVGAATILLAELARRQSGIDDQTRELRRLTYVLDHRKKRLKLLKTRAEREGGLEEDIELEQEDLKKLRRSRSGLEESLVSDRAWCDALHGATADLMASMGSGKRRSAAKMLWDVADESPHLPTRRAAVEVLGRVGPGGTARELAKMMESLAKDRRKLEKTLPKLVEDVHELERRMQAEHAQTGGRGGSSGLVASYNKKRLEAADVRRQLTQLGRLADSCAQAGGVALANETEKTQAATLDALVRSLAKARDGVRLRTLTLLAAANTEPVRERVLEWLVDDADSAAAAHLLAELSTRDEQALIPIIFEHHLDHPDWNVQSAAFQALDRLRSRAAIPALIDGLEQREGRLVTEIRAALRSLTGKDFRTNVTLWRKWWGEAGEDFEVPPIEEIALVAKAQEKEDVGVTFFGIRTESQRVLFVLDLSGSMNFSMTGGERPPRNGESSRLEVARRDLIQALGGLRDGALFNLVFYASDVWLWQKKLLTLDTDARAELYAHIEDMNAEGGTNIFRALETALDLAGADGGDEWTSPEIDTIFLLSDGMASMGETTDADEILEFVRERNASAGIVIHTIGLSAEQDAYLLRSLAEQNGGTYAAH